MLLGGREKIHDISQDIHNLLDTSIHSCIIIPFQEVTQVIYTHTVKKGQMGKKMFWSCSSWSFFKI